MPKSTIVQVELTHQREIQQDPHQSVQRVRLDITARMALFYLSNVQLMHIARLEVLSLLIVR